MIGVQPIEIPIRIALRDDAAAVHDIRSLDSCAGDFHHRTADDGRIDVVGTRAAFRLLDALPIPVKAVAAGRPAIDTLQAIRPVPLIGRRSCCRHIAGVVVREINRRGAVVIAARAVIDGRVARPDFRKGHPNLL